MLRRTVASGLEASRGCSLTLLPLFARFLMTTEQRRDWGALDGCARDVLQRASSFAGSGRSADLLPRDQAGLDDEGWDAPVGRFLYVDNAIAMPAALAAIQRLADEHWLPEELGAQAGRFGRTWASARTLFEVRGESLHAAALDEEGRRVNVRHLGEALGLLLDDPPAEAVDAVVAGLQVPYPEGMLTPVGLAEENPFAVAPQSLPEESARRAKVRDWQQGFAVAALERQLGRRDLSETTLKSVAGLRTDLLRRVLSVTDHPGLRTWSLDGKGLRPESLSDRGEAGETALQLRDLLAGTILLPLEGNQDAD